MENTKQSNDVLGIELYNAQKFEEAIIRFETILEKDPFNILALNYSGSIYLLNKNFDKALERFCLVLDMDHENKHALINKGKAQWGKKSLIAINTFENALDSFPENEECLENLGLIYQSLNSFDKANQYFKRLLKHYPENEHCLFNLGLIYQSLNNYDEAKKHIIKSLRINSKNILALNTLGEMTSEKGETKLAIACFERVLENDFLCKEAYLGLKRIFEVNKIPDFESSHLVFKSRKLYQLGLEELTRKNIMSAKILFKISIKNNQKGNYSYIELGKLELKVSKYKEAKSLFLEALKFNETNEEAHFYLGEIHFSLNMPEEAMNHFDEVIRFKRNYLEDAYIRKGQIYDFLGEITQALQSYNSVIKINNYNIIANIWFIKYTFNNYKKNHQTIYTYLTKIFYQIFLQNDVSLILQVINQILGYFEINDPKMLEIAIDQKNSKITPNILMFIIYMKIGETDISMEYLNSQLFPAHDRIQKYNSLQVFGFLFEIRNLEIFSKKFFENLALNDKLNEIIPVVCMMYYFRYGKGNKLAFNLFDELSQFLIKYNNPTEFQLLKFLHYKSSPYDILNNILNKEDKHIFINVCFKFYQYYADINELFNASNILNYLIMQDPRNERALSLRKEIKTSCKNSTCGICFEEIPDEFYLSPCNKHINCRICTLKLIKHTDFRCPICREPLKTKLYIF